MLALSTLTQAYALAAMIGIVAVLPAVIRAYGITRAQAGLVAVAPNLGLLLSLTIWGAAVDRLGGRRTLGVASVLAGMCAVLASHMQSLPMLVLALALIGVAAGAFFPASGRMVARWFNERRGLAMGISQSFVPIAGLTTALWIPATASALGWRSGSADLWLGSDPRRVGARSKLRRWQWALSSATAASSS